MSGDNTPNEQIKLIVPSGQAKVRLDTYLTHQIQNVTRNKIQQAIKAGKVTVNGKNVKPSVLISPKDVIIVTLQRPPRPKAVA